MKSALNVSLATYLHTFFCIVTVLFSTALLAVAGIVRELLSSYDDFLFYYGTVITTYIFAGYTCTILSTLPGSYAFYVRRRKLMVALTCCGKEDAKDWDEILTYIPSSCCPRRSPQVNSTECRILEDFFIIQTAGCLQKLQRMPMFSMNVICGLSLGVMVTEVINTFDEADSKYIAKAKAAFKMKGFMPSLTFIKAYMSVIPEAVLNLESRGMELVEVVATIQGVIQEADS
ncbi:uncharacterized protein [Anabrus simplex]|uniref:uncharacterized protein isoform X3 n=1 Tax=Anabrus simplex TaxID=316456 RepID=UPI0035A3C8C8